MPPKAYHIADFDAYERGCGKRWAMYTSSPRLPLQLLATAPTPASTAASGTRSPGAVCRRDRRPHPPLSAGDALGRRRQLHGRSRSRHAASPRVSCAPRSQFEWSVQATTNMVARLTHEDLTLLRRAGLQQICQGVDSGSPKVLQLMNKTFQDFDQIYESAARCLSAEHPAILQHHLRLPRRGVEGAPRDCRLHDGCLPPLPRRGVLDQHLHPLSRFSHHEQRAGDGHRSSQDARRLGRLLPRYTTLPWLKGKEHSGCRSCGTTFRIAFDRIPIASRYPRTLSPASAENLSLPARWRLDHDVYKFPVEIWLNNKLKKRVANAHKPAIDAKRLANTPAEAAC